MTDSPRCVERSVRIYAALIKAYPASFRSEYADEMILVFRDLATDAWDRRGVCGLLALWLRVLVDLVRTAPKEHLLNRKTHKGGIAVGIKSLFTREIFPDLSPEAQLRWFPIRLLVLFANGLLFGGAMICKLMSMNLTEPQRFLGIVLAVALVLQFIGYGMLTPLGKRKDRSRYYASPGQIILFGASILTLILGIRQLASMAITEYEFILGLLILFELMLSLAGSTDSSAGAGRPSTGAGAAASVVDLATNSRGRTAPGDIRVDHAHSGGC